MAPSERKAYTDAINCLRNQPSQLDRAKYPAAINRYMDYAVVHVNRTREVHLNGYFLLWHRYYLHLFEQDLKNTCGYTGAFPYWNWPATADDLSGSNIFNGDEYSMSSDGEYIPNKSGQSTINDTTNALVLSPFFQIQHGSGGGCIKSGPFKGMMRTIDTISVDYLINGTDIPADAFDYRPSCLTRDLNTFAAQTWCNATAVQQTVEAPDIVSFYSGVNGKVGGTSLGIHGGAHFTMGDPLSNIFSSVQDPVWWPLHVMLDRVYTSWQMRHPEQRLSLFGTETAVNLPPSANVTLDSVMPDWGYFDLSNIKVSDLMSPQAGPFCYKYDTPL